MKNHLHYMYSYRFKIKFRTSSGRSHPHKNTSGDVKNQFTSITRLHERIVRKTKNENKKTIAAY